MTTDENPRVILISDPAFDEVQRRERDLLSHVYRYEDMTMTIGGEDLATTAPPEITIPERRHPRGILHVASFVAALGGAVAFPRPRPPKPRDPEADERALSRAEEKRVRKAARLRAVAESGGMRKVGK